MLPKNQQVVSRDRFDEIFREEATIAEFPTKEAEVAYERRDSFLIHLIRREVERSFGSDPDAAPFVGDDWWPDHTRHLEATLKHCTSDFLDSLRALLTGEFRFYRIQLCVYGDILDGKSYIGSMALYADRVLIERDLHALLARQKA